MRPKYGGRTKGTPNKDSVPAMQKAQELGIDPFEVLLLFAGGKNDLLGYKDAIDANIRMKAASEACQYILPKKKAVELSNKDEEGFKVVLVDYMKPA